MAVPKKKTSPSRKGMRASAKHVKFTALTSCDHCGESRYPHHMCTHCGHYKGRHVITTRMQKRAAKTKTEDME